MLAPRSRSITTRRGGKTRERDGKEKRLERDWRWKRERESEESEREEDEKRKEKKKRKKGQKARQVKTQRGAEGEHISRQR